MSHAKPDLTVDIVLLTLIEGRLHVALSPRESEPAKGKWALVGGTIHPNVDSDSTEAALRVVREKLDIAPRHMEQVFTEANGHRTPSGWSASIVHLALHDPKSLTETVERHAMQLFDAEDGGAHLPKGLAFDHKLLINKVVQLLTVKANYSTIVGHFLAEPFTLAEFQSAYEAVLDVVINPANFRQKILKRDTDLLEPMDMVHSFGRPARGYRLIRHLEYFDRVLVEGTRAAA